MLGYPVTINLTRTANIQSRRTWISQNASQRGVRRHRRCPLRSSRCRLRHRRRRIASLHPTSQASHRKSNQWQQSFKSSGFQGTHRATVMLLLMNLQMLEVMVNIKDDVYAAEKRKRGTASASGKDAGWSRKQQVVSNASEPLIMPEPPMLPPPNPSAAPFVPLSNPTCCCAAAAVSKAVPLEPELTES